MSMATVFSNVEADIADDLITKFPQEFDFDSMLRKVCEDAGVAIDPTMNKPKNGEDMSIVLDKPAKYRLKGLWFSMEKAYKHLVTTLALYGTRLPEAFSEQDASDFNHHHDIEDMEDMHDDENDKDYNPKMRNIIQGIIEDNKRQRRPRKSARQSRRVVGDLADLSFDEEDFNENNIKSDMDQSAEDPSDNEDDAGDEENRTDNLQETNNDENSLELKEEVKPRKRGRPRKNTSPFHLTSKSKLGKKRGPYKKSTNNVSEVVPPVSTEDPDDALPARRRGRPKIYNDEGKTDFPCSECSFVAKKRAKLRSHKLRMHLASPTMCDVCKKIFPNKRYMLRHRASHVAPQHCCDVCGKMYKIRKAMLEHRKTHDNNFKKTKVKCEMCPKSFCNRYILECHIRDIHMGQKKSYLCSTCGKSFTTKHSLAEHTNAHTGVKPHICEHCGKSFSYESALRDHRYTHTDAKHFWCTHCQKGFSQRSGLKMHMRIHRQHKMFICTECGRGFTQKQALQRHERVHKGEKPFICKHCGRFFTDASIIRRHLILVHKIHKDANHWREDIVCIVKPQNEYQVQKIGEENSLSEAEKEKDELLKTVGPPSRTNNKGPSRAFCRTYPRRVALLDEAGNVIAPPELPPRPVLQQSKSNESGSTNSCSKTQTNSEPNNTALILATENSSDLDSNNQVIQQRFVEGTQWDVLAGQIGRGGATHMDHMMLDDSAQHEIQRGIEHVQGIHKIIKFENIQPTVVQAPSHNLLTHSQSSQSPSTSPISFSTQPVAHGRVLESSFENLNPQVAHTGSQYYDGRTTGHSSTSWSSMFYYSQLASQFGMSINPEYPYVAGNTSSSPTTTQLGQYQTTTHQANPTIHILHSQTQIPHIESPKLDEHRNQPNNSGQSGLTNSLHHSSQDLGRHVTSGMKLSSNDTLHQADIMLQQEIQNSPSHMNTTDAQHVSNLVHITSNLSDPQNMLIRHVNDSRQSSPNIPLRNPALLNIKHK
ncbi:zinc finger and BTB domain-containing protein 24-like [Physella acuta]|uniref:zinc finger and BTB domain-containing protein 24-like n=1 Tax=Physella acuta TaxID=109671 RepID=UPI0027DE7EDF|nr:zinc finger and BTB domain-containing protein 24-like [Physella acuta]